tara:strand:+ start:176 stop:952 length:777 start_codon:yes stop_codon:yes gene_type:complete
MEVDPQDVEEYLTGLLQYLVKVYRDKKMKGITKNLSSSRIQVNERSEQKGVSHSSQSQFHQLSINGSISPSRDEVEERLPYPFSRRLKWEFANNSVMTPLTSGSSKSGNMNSKHSYNASETDSLLRKMAKRQQYEAGLELFRKWLSLWDPILHWFLFDLGKGQGENEKSSRSVDSAAVDYSDLASVMWTTGETMDFSEAIIEMKEVSNRKKCFRVSRQRERSRNCQARHGLYFATCIPTKFFLIIIYILFLGSDAYLY